MYVQLVIRNYLLSSPSLGKSPSKNSKIKQNTNNKNTKEKLNSNWTANFVEFKTCAMVKKIDKNIFRS